MSYQKITIVGNLGGLPIPGTGDKIWCRFNVASNRFYTVRGERVKETTWFNVICFNRLAEVCVEFLSTGDQVLVEGVLSPDTTTGGPKIYTLSDGTPGASYDIKAGRVVFLSVSTTADQDYLF